jgi:hypothetical protein
MKNIQFVPQHHIDTILLETIDMCHILNDVETPAIQKWDRICEEEHIGFIIMDSIVNDDIDMADLLKETTNVMG